MCHWQVLKDINFEGPKSVCFGEIKASLGLSGKRRKAKPGTFSKHLHVPAQDEMARNGYFILQGSCGYT